MHSGNLYASMDGCGSPPRTQGTDSRSGRKGRRTSVWGWSDDASERDRIQDQHWPARRQGPETALSVEAEPYILSRAGRAHLTVPLPDCCEGPRASASRR